jgi:hypothetical protein
MTASQHAKSILLMQDVDRAKTWLALADTQPSRLLVGENPRLIDEWQMAPVLWDAVRAEVDKRGGVPGQFLLTGSAVPCDHATSHTGTGRIARLMMRPMSLFESGESSGQVSIKSLFDGAVDENSVIESKMTIDDIAYAICRGGWPVSVSMERDYALDVSRNYVDAIIEEDVSRVDGVERNPQRVFNLLKSLSRNISTMATNTTVMQDMTASDGSMSAPTLDSYLNALRRIFVIDDLMAWSPSMRSKTAVRTTPKRHFVDPSIATAVLRTNPDGLIEDFNTFGFLFESLCTRDFKIYAQANDGDLYHYRDKSNLEADIIMALRNGKWAAIEVKLGSKQIEEAAANLLKLKEKINTEKMGEPSFLMVVTGGDVGYRRADGVWVVPLACLRD